MATTAGVVLAGGRSSRMGTPKAELEWHGSTMLYRTVAILARVTDGPAVVVRAPGQALPDLPEGTLVTADPRAGKGPVQGIAAGLTALEGRADVAFVGSTDMPFLHPAFVRRVLRALDDRDDADVALPFARGYKQPLAAAYRVRLADTAERLAEAGRLRPAFLFEQCRVETLDDDELRRDALLAALDPDLDSVVNVNTPEDYDAARARPAPAVTVRLFGALARGDDTGRPQAARLGTGTGTGTAVIVSAGTVGGAADAVGLTFGPHVTAALNAGQITCDARTPLTTGDSVFFLPTGGR